MPKLFIVDPSLKSRAGHYFGYASRVASAAGELGVVSTILASSTATLTASRTLVPCFSRDYWEEMSGDGSIDPYTHLELSAQRFALELGSALDSGRASADDAVFLPCANLVEVEGMARLAARYGPALPRTALLFRRDLDEQGVDARVGARTVPALLRRALAALRVNPSHDRLRLFTDSDALTDDYAERLQWRVQTAPIPVDPRFTPADGLRRASPIVVSYFGDARREKGYHRLPGVADLLRPALDRGDLRLVIQSNFNLPGGETGIAQARELLKAGRGIEILDEPLVDEDYCRRMAATHLLVLPYDADRYVARTSGILAEAIHAGVPVVVPDGTWLSEQLRRHGAGVSFDPWQSDGLERSVERALTNLPDLLARARDRRRAFVAFHNPGRLARFVCGAAMLDRQPVADTAAVCS